MTDQTNVIDNSFKDVIFVFNEEGIITEHLTPSHSRYLFKHESQIENNHYKDILRQDFLDEMNTAFEKIKQNATSAQFNKSIEIDGETVWYSTTISRTKQDKNNRYLAVIKNITKRIDSEKALKECQEEYQSIINNSPDIFYKLNKNGKILEVSPSVEKHTGFSPEELIGKPAMNFYFYKDGWKKLLDIIKKRGEVVDFEARLRTKSNKMIHASTNAYPKTDEKGNITGFEGYIRNISGRKETEEELVKTNRELQKLNRQKDKLFSAIAHDLKNTVSGPQGLYSIIFEDYDSLSKEELFEYLLILRKSVNNQAELLEDLLLWAKNQFENVSINPEEVHLNEIIREVLDLTDFSASEKNIHFINRVNDTIKIYADPDMLKIIIRNLINNAIKFSYQNGRIWLDTDESENEVKVAITDEGVGMSEEVVDKIFKKDIHYTTKGTGGEKGSGLGLDLCLDFIEKHNGTINAKSKPGEGTTIEFCLPKR